MTDWDGKIKIALITGQHPFVVQDLQGFFRSIDEVDCYPQHMEDFVNDIGGARTAVTQPTPGGKDPYWGHPHLDYDVLVFYNMQRSLPDPDERFQKREIEVVNLLGETSQGILMLHHAVLAYQGWQPWSEICGIEDRSYGGRIGGRSEREHPITITPANPDHPITENMEPWEMVDETYMINEPGEDCEPLLTTDDPKSMTTLGWTRQHGRSRVMVYTGGHSRIAYNTPEFRKVVIRGIQWLAGRL